MPDVADGDIIRITAKLSYSGGDIQNVFHVRFAGSPHSDTTFMSEAGGILDTAYGQVNPQLSSTVTYDTIAYFNITQDRPMGEIAWPVQTVGGNSTGEHLPPQTSPVVLFGTYTPKSQGRKYLPLLTTNNTGNLGSVDSVVLTAMSNFAADFITARAITAGTISFGNWAPLLTRFAPWISAFIKDVLCTQRRRRASVGS